MKAYREVSESYVVKLVKAYREVSESISFKLFDMLKALCQYDFVDMIWTQLKMNRAVLMTKKIYHRNDIRPALMEMSLSARRLACFWLSSLPREKNLETGRLELRFDPDSIFELKVLTYAEACNIDYSAAYRQMVDGVQDLMRFILTVDHNLTKKIDPSLPKDWIAPFQVAQSGTGYSKGEGYVRIKFAPELAPLVSDLQQGFTGQLLSSALALSEPNASKLYLILREWVSSNKYFHEKVIILDELKDILAVSNVKTYESFNSFKNLFFARAVKKLIEKTEFTEVKMEIVERRSRKAYKVKVSYKYSSKEMEDKDQVVSRVLSKKASESPSKLIKRSAIDILEEKISNFNFNED